jgi:hypothetical protein
MQKGVLEKYSHPCLKRSCWKDCFEDFVNLVLIYTNKLLNNRPLMFIILYDQTNQNVAITGSVAYFQAVNMLGGSTPTVMIVVLELK